MKATALMCLLLITVGCGKPPLNTNSQGAPPANPGENLCNASDFPKNKGGSSSCCMEEDPWREGNEVWFVFGTQGSLGHRYLGKACTNGTRQGKPVSFGPCGAAVDPNYGSGTDAKVFKPAGYACGYQFTKTDGTPFYFPRQYAGEWRYPAVDAACRYTACLGTTPVIEMVLVLNTPGVASMGRVVSDPPGITASRAGEFHGQFPGDVTLRAEPTGKHVRAVFSGDCSKIGGYGERVECVVKLAPDPKVTVNFECEQGFSCGAGGKH